MTYQGVFEIRFPNLGVSLKDGPDGEVIEWSTRSDFLVATDEWSVTVLDLRDQPRWYEMQPCEIYVNGRLQVLGRCDWTERGGSSSVIRLGGRDYLADLTTCAVDPVFTVKAGTPIEKAFLLAMAPCGITSIVGPEERNSQRTGGLANPSEVITSKQLQDNKPADSQSIFSWCNRIAARHGWTLQPSSKRSQIVMQRPTYGGVSIGKIVSRRRDVANPTENMLVGGAGTARRDFSELPTYLLMMGQYGTTEEARKKPSKFWEIMSVANTLGGEFAKIVNSVQVGRRKPNEVLGQEIENWWLYRLRIIRDKQAKSAEQINAAVSRVVASALKESLKYTCTIKGTTTLPDNSGYTWAPDCQVDVDDDIARVHETLWIANREFRGSMNNGVTTTLECWRPRSFQINPEENG